MGEQLSQNALFAIGDLVHHKRFDYRGVVIDVDPVFMHTDEWYDTVAKSRPPKDRPWYRVLVDGASHETYVAQSNLESDASNGQIVHPDLSQHFEAFEGGRYVASRRAN